MADLDEVMRAIGQLEGMLGGIAKEQGRQAELNSRMDKRLGKLEQHVATIVAEQARHTQQNERADERLDKLEQKVSGAFGWAAGAGAAASLAFSVVMAVFGGRMPWDR